jgi:hypothetical protein
VQCVPRLKLGDVPVPVRYSTGEQHQLRELQASTR